ncbi:unnamed protein product [Orchesella dallaii]|uniref:Arrestin C-terminal-like domain-containing protein n=1 Tax=Orchesella dallaii TaxID=48710 RepID=A0ABP1Q9B8_9HEXA
MFKILLDEPSMQYKRGQFVSGKLVIKVDREVKCKNITLILKGQADVQFIYGNEDDKYTYSYFKEFFNFQAHLVGDGETETSISPDEEYTFDFAFQLPSQALPASFKGSYGKVKYVLEGKVKRSFWERDFNILQPITILGELDQEHVSEAKLPSEVKMSKTFGFCCCTSGPLFLHVRVPIRGCVPGETIYFNVEVNNMSRKRIVDLSAKILQTVDFTGKHEGSEETMNTYACFNELRRGEGVSPGDSETWRDVLVVPSVPPTKLGAGCEFIDVQYFILVRAHVADLMARSPKALCPIVIGTSRQELESNRRQYMN